MSAQVRHDDAIAVWVARKDVTPVVADTHPAVKKQERLAAAAILEGHLEPIEGNRGHASQASASGGAGSSEVI
jgi:hypothetical protein